MTRYTDKHLVPVERFCSEALPARSVYALGVHEAADIRINEADAVQRFAIVANNTYRYGFLDLLGLRQVHFVAATRPAQSVQVYQITRPASTFLPEELVDRLGEELGKSVNATQKQEVG